jgi:hypothetical protein
MELADRRQAALQGIQLLLLVFGEVGGIQNDGFGRGMQRDSAVGVAPALEVLPIVGVGAARGRSPGSVKTGLCLGQNSVQRGADDV